MNLSPRQTQCQAAHAIAVAFVCMLAILMGGIERASAQEPADAPAAVADDADTPNPEAELHEKRRAATVAIYLLAGIVLLGFVLLMMIWIWGMRMRRMARSSTRQPTAIDPLWYLRPKKHPQEPPADAEPNAGDAENT